MMAPAAVPTLQLSLGGPVTDLTWFDAGQLRGMVVQHIENGRSAEAA